MGRGINASLRLQCYQRLRVIFLPGHRPTAGNGREYREAYHMWRLVWEEELQNLGVLRHDQRISPDNFTKQDEWVCILSGKKCVAMAALRWVNIRSPAIKIDTYFKTWPTHVIEGLRAKWRVIIIFNQLTIHPSYRGRYLVDLITGLSVKCFLASKADVMIGNPRRDRKVDRVLVAFQAEELGKGEQYGVGVRLMAFDRYSVERGRPATQDCVERLWKRATPQRVLLPGIRRPSRVSGRS